MLIAEKLAIAVIYCCFVFLLNGWLTTTIGRRWHRQELARRAIGIASVMGLALPAIYFGQLNGYETWVMLLAGFVSAALPLLVRHIEDGNKHHEALVQSVLAEDDDESIH